LALTTIELKEPSFATVTNISGYRDRVKNDARAGVPMAPLRRRDQDG
jgi:hypothetical protein